MRYPLYGALALGVGLIVSPSAPGQETFALTSPVESATVPNLDTTLLIEGEVGQMVDFTGKLTLTSSGLTVDPEAPEGPQGWSLGIRNEGVDILSTTVEGTVSARSDQGGLVNGGFVVTELIDPNKKGNDGKQGMVQAVVLSFTLPVSLPPNTSQITAINSYRATIADTEVNAGLRFEDGLIGKGQPVQNNVTYKGATRIPTLGDKRITIRKSVQTTPENTDAACKDSVDNDGDGKTDCADEECAAFCPTPENTDAACKDTLDNDQDGKTDSADEDCAAFCPTPENTDAACKDTVDNDQDGKTDCQDEDCAAFCGTGDTGFDLIISAAGSTRDGTKNVVNVECPGTPSITAVFSIAPTQQPEANGAQGWSISVTHDATKLDIENGNGFPTIDGTDAAALFNGGFKKTEVVDPAKNNGKSGFVSAVVLSFTSAANLDPTKDQTIALSKYTLKDGACDTLPTSIMFMDGLRGAGQPVQNIITVNGSSVNPTRLISLEIGKGIGPPPQGEFIRGNANDDGKVNIADPIWIINELVRQGPKTQCQDAADANDDGLLDLSDAMFLIQWRFLGGTAPTAPFPGCGADPSADNLACPEDSATSCP